LLLLYVDFSIHFMDWIGLSRVLFYQQNIVWVGCQLLCNVFSTIMAEEKLTHQYQIRVPTILKNNPEEKHATRPTQTFM
jgi:hypothetical protein